ncbi:MULTISPECIES: hypothetical protein [Streptomyces]|uniref:hypothetical protein n=1 Tax=Streptomyces TaxID=1883 RepID=UPI00073DBAF1|nr:hypothetical protein [Streptomyces sp. FBKL.4005]CUW29729.1 hypothetical protein TUE45_04438 [Streptomyces reticuli]
MCEHQHGHRFDPGQCTAACSVCGAWVGAERGQPAAHHQKPGSRETCPGSGAPTN